MQHHKNSRVDLNITKKIDIMNIERKILLVIFLTITMLVQGQESGQHANLTYSYYSKAEIGDSVQKVYCKISINNVKKFKKIKIIYNNQEHIYPISALNELSTERYYLDNDMIYFNIPENIETPYVEVFGFSASNEEVKFYYKNSKGSIIDPEQAKKVWKQQKTRLDSLEQIRQ